MKCNDIKELLSLYIDRLLDESQAKEVEDHLSSCDSCRKEYNEMKEIIDLLGQTEMIPVPDAFGLRLKKALKEEKQNMIETGILGKPAKKKHQWRMITSVAAIFAVGVITLSLYSDVLGILPGRLNGDDQTGAPEAAREFITGNADDSTGNPDLLVEDSGTLEAEEEHQSIAMMDTDPAADQEAKNFSYKYKENETAKETPSEDQTTIYGTTEGGGSEPDSNTEPGMLQDSGAQESAAAADGGYGNFARNSKLAASLEECSRSLTFSGVERNAAAVQFYNNLIQERLAGFDYQILESVYTQTGKWQFRVFIFRGKDGNTYNEEILIAGKDGEIEVTCANKFMGL